MQSKFLFVFMMKEEGIKLRYALSVVSNSSLVGIGLIRI